MAQLEDKPALDSAPANVLTEVPCDGDNTGELNDALIDDQVMVFPKWQATCKYKYIIHIVASHLSSLLTLIY